MLWSVCKQAASIKRQEPAKNLMPVLAHNDVKETLFLRNLNRHNHDHLSASLDADLTSTGFSGFREMEPQHPILHDSFDLVTIDLVRKPEAALVITSLVFCKGQCVILQ